MELVQEKETGGQRRESYSVLLVLLNWPKLENLTKRVRACVVEQFMDFLGMYLEFCINSLILIIPVDKIDLFSSIFDASWA